MKPSIRHRQVAVLKGAGLSNEQVAQQLGVSPTTVSRVCRSPQVKYLIASTEEKIRERVISAVAEQFAGAVAEALQSLVRLAKSSDQPSLQLAAAQTILNHLPQEERSR